jgi:FHS family L-fucose permease-like MFS transporter
MISSNNKTAKSNFLVTMFVLGSLFFIFGLVSWVNSILIPYFKVACELTYTQSYFVALAFYIAYLVISIPASKLLNAVGYRRGLSIGLWFMALGTFIFIPAALTRTYAVFLIGLFTIGTGLSILQTASNPLVTVIGPIESAGKRISIMGLCNKIAGIIAPLIFAAIVLRPTDNQLFEALNNNLITGANRIATLNELIRRVIPPYAVLGTFLFLFGLLIRYIHIPDIQNGDNDNNPNTKQKSILQYPYLILGVFALFFHLASQAISINTVIDYAQSMGLDINTAKIFPSITLGFTLLGYFLGIIFVPKILSQKTMLQICTVVGFILSICIMCFSGAVHLFGLQTDISIWFVCLLGLPNSFIYAGIWPLAIHDLGKHTNLGSSLLVMALCGSAFMPVIYGMLADAYSTRMGYIVIIPCFIYLLFYSFYGYKINYWHK